MSMPKRFTRVGPKEAAEHSCLPPEIPCVFWGEYTPHEYTDGKRNDYSPTNRLIGNFKKAMNRKGQSDWRYKLQAIEEAAERLARAIKWSALEGQSIALVPMPPSKPKGHPSYDDRMLQLVQKIASNALANLQTQSVAVDIHAWDCLTIDGSLPSSHSSASSRPSAFDVLNATSFDTQQNFAGRKPDKIFVFDDVLTTGAHFAAAHARLSERLPNTFIAGFFLARTVRPVATGFESFFTSI